MKQLSTSRAASSTFVLVKRRSEVKEGLQIWGGFTCRSSRSVAFTFYHSHCTWSLTTEEQLRDVEHLTFSPPCAPAMPSVFMFKQNGQVVASAS
jgi:hypothetical protein